MPHGNPGAGAGTGRAGGVGAENVGGGFSSRDATQSRDGPNRDRPGSLTRSPELGGRRPGQNVRPTVADDFDKLPSFIRRTPPMQFLELLTKGLGLLGGGLSELFENFDLEPGAFDTPEALGPGGDGPTRRPGRVRGLGFGRGLLDAPPPTGEILPEPPGEKISPELQQFLDQMFRLSNLR